MTRVSEETGEILHGGPDRYERFGWYELGVDRVLLAGSTLRVWLMTGDGGVNRVDFDWTGLTR